MRKEKLQERMARFRKEPEAGEENSRVIKDLEKDKLAEREARFGKIESEADKKKKKGYLDVSLDDYKLKKEAKAKSAAKGAIQKKGGPQGVKMGRGSKPIQKGRDSRGPVRGGFRGSKGSIRGGARK